MQNAAGPPKRIVIPYIKGVSEKISFEFGQFQTSNFALHRMQFKQ